MFSARRCQLPLFWTVCLFFAAVFAVPHAHAEGAAKTVRVGTLKFGTVNWELDVMSRHGLDAAHGFMLKPLDFAGKDGAAVALQGGEVDVILTDWLWVAKRRAMGGDFAFVPHSHVTGALIVRNDSGIKALEDVKGKKIGIGGGPADKSWILLRAFAQKQLGFDPAREATPVFAAPPLLNETMKRGELAAVLNFWQYNARLDPGAFTELVKVEDMLPALGLPPDMPLLGWVFAASWAKTNPDLAMSYIAAAAEARHILATQPAEWQTIRPLTGADSDATLERLRLAYGRGVGGDDKTPPAEREAQAQKMIDLLTKLGDKDEAPPDGKLPLGTFYAGFPS